MTDSPAGIQSVDQLEISIAMATVLGVRHMWNDLSASDIDVASVKVRFLGLDAGRFDATSFNRNGPWTNPRWGLHCPIQDGGLLSKIHGPMTAVDRYRQPNQLAKAWEYCDETGFDRHYTGG